MRMIARFLSISSSATRPKLPELIGGASDGAVKLMRTRIRLLAQPESIRSIIDATQSEQRFD